MHMLKTKMTLAILGLTLVALLVAFLVWAKSRPSLKVLSRDNISPTLLGYTNDASGTRLARIGITNLSGLVVYVYQPIIEIPAATAPGGVSDYPPGQKYYHSDYFRWHALLHSGGSAVFSAPLPTNASRWRFRFLAGPEVQTTPKRLPYEIYSAWIKSKK